MNDSSENPQSASKTSSGTLPEATTTPGSPPMSESPVSSGAEDTGVNLEKQGGGGCFKIGCLSCLAVLLIICVTVVATWWWITRKEKFDPVVLSEPEKVLLETKLDTVNLMTADGGQSTHSTGAADAQSRQGVVALPPGVATGSGVGEMVMDPEEVRRTIIITQRELNGLFHEKYQEGDQFKILLVRDGIEIKMSLQLPEDSAIMPGKNIRGKIRLYMAFDDEELVIKVDGVSLGAVPVPNAWLEVIGEAVGVDKDANLVEAFLGSPEMSEKFSEGIEKFEIKDGQLLLKLAE